MAAAAPANPPVTFNDWLQVRIALTADAATAFIGVGIDSVEGLGRLERDDVVNLCKTLRRPGGEIVVPAVGNAAATTKSNPGVSISYLAEMDLITYSYAIRMRAHTSRQTTIGDLTTDEAKRWEY